MSQEDGAKRIDGNFAARIRSGNLPSPHRGRELSAAGLTDESLVDLFESQVMSRQLDLCARRLRSEQQSFYTIGSSGHEGNAAFGRVFSIKDMAFLHYRDAALFIQRSKQIDGLSVLYDLLLSFVASSEDPISGGRHKVLGSRQMLVPPQTSTIASHLPKAVGAALSISRALSLGAQRVMDEDSVVLCSFGDASANHSTALGAINSACWCAHRGMAIPLIFLCEDNGVGISVTTPYSWISSAFSHRNEMSYLPCNGFDVVDVHHVAMEAETIARQDRRPVFVHMKTVRLMGHAGSDIESGYRSRQRIEADEAQDPLLHSARRLMDDGIMHSGEIIEFYRSIRERVDRIAQEVVRRPKLISAPDVFSSLWPGSDKTRCRICPKLPSLQQREVQLGHRFSRFDQRAPLGRLINLALAELLLRYPESVVFGEDVGKKGGVYGVTQGLQEQFGVKRVFDTLLDEQSILGAAIGMSHNGILPIPEIQFLAYVHNAEDQIRGEAATLSFFSDGQFSNPMVVRIAGLAYQKGFGGHFHNDNSIAVFRDIPGIIVACPSRGSDAVRMLRSCVRSAYESGQVVVFLEPIALYGQRDLLKPGDGQWSDFYPSPEEEIAIGEYGVHGSGSDVAIVSYGNGFYLGSIADHHLREQYGIHSTMIDLRWLHPLNEPRLIEILKDFRRIVIVDECRRSGSLSEAISALILESLHPLPQVRRITAMDCPIPLGDAANLLLPQVDQIVDVVRSLCAKEAGG